MSIVKGLLKRMWRLTKPLRQAIALRFDQHLDGHLQSWLSRVERVHADQQQTTAEIQLVADAMVRELVRLQSQIQRLHEEIADQSIAAVHRPAGEAVAARRQVA